MTTAMQPHNAPVRPANSPLRIHVETNRSAVEAVWLDLEQKHGNGSFACSWSWTSTWLEAWGDAIEHWFVIAEVNREPVAIALLTRGKAQRRGPLPVRTVHIGTAGETPGEGVWIEYNRLLAAPEHKGAFANALRQGPGVRAGGADVLQFDGFAPEELAGLDQGRGKSAVRTCYATLLQESSPPIESLDRETRRKIRNGMKRFTESYGELQTEWISDPSRASVVQAELIRLHQERWTNAGEPGAFASVRFRAFHDQLITRRIADGGVVLIRVTAGEQLVGIFYGLVEGNVIYHYQWGLSAFSDNRLAPGFVTGYLVLDEARRRRFAELNWLAGESRYKKDLSNTVRSLVWAEFPLSPWMYTVTGLMSAKRTLRGRR